MTKLTMLTALYVLLFVCILSAGETFLQTPLPAGNNSGQLNFFSSKTALYLSWLEGFQNSKALKFAKWDGKTWSAANTVIASVPFFVNWADFPSIAVTQDGSLVAHWLQKSSAGSYSYDVMISISKDDGKTWSAPFTPHRDRKKAEHGFVSLIPLTGSKFSAVWLDGRNFRSEDESMHDLDDEMALMYAECDGTNFSNDIYLDKRVCDCCQTTAVTTSKGIFVAYRDRSAQEIRDISYVYSRNGKWSEPKNLNADHWKIEGCPVNGPVVAAFGDHLIAVWFTGTQDKPQVQAKLSLDGGETFGPAMRIDQGNSSGRVHAAWLNSRKAVVSWLENTSSGPEVRIREIDVSGKVSQFETITQTSNARSSGFARLGVFGNDLFVAWMESGESSRIRAARRRIE